MSLILYEIASNMTIFFVRKFSAKKFFTLYTFSKMVDLIDENSFDWIARRDNASNIKCSFFDLILIRIGNADKNCETRINFKFNLSVLENVSDVWLINSTIAEWSMNTITEDFLHDSIKCLIFLTIQTTPVIFNSIDQYFFSHPTVVC